MQQVCGAVEFQEIDSRFPVTAAGSVMDLHHFPNGSRSRSTQSDIRRSVVFTVRSKILSVILVLHRKMYPTMDSSNHQWTFQLTAVAGLQRAVRSSGALLGNNDTIILRSIIRRTRGVRLASEGTLYERIGGALEEPIEKARSKRRSVLSVGLTRHTPGPSSNSPRRTSTFC